MKGFKKTGRGPTYGNFKFPRSTVEVRPHNRSLPAKKFADGGAVNGALTKRNNPVTELDAESGGKTPVRPGFADGGKVGNLGAALRAVRRMVDSGLDPTAAARKAAAMHGVDESQLTRDAAKKGLTPDPAMLARGGFAGAAMSGLARAAGQALKVAPSRPAPQATKAGARPQVLPPSRFARGGVADCAPGSKKSGDRHGPAPKLRGLGLSPIGRRGT